MPKLHNLAPRLQARTPSLVQPQPKQADPKYMTPEYRAWRAYVVARAGGRCEALDHGFRCNKATPEHRVYADHITELKDGGLLLDPANGMCLCRSHHELKTIKARTKRLQTQY